VKLFDDRDRTDLGPARYGESHSAYLQRTARPEFALVRAAMEEWLNEYPKSHRRKLARRLALPDDVHFEAAFFELYIHRLLRALGGKVRVEPKLSGSQGRPDFEVRFEQPPRILVEAVTVDEVSRSERAARARLQDVYDALNKVSAPDYFFRVAHSGEPRTPIPGKRVRHQVQQFVNHLNYEEVRQLAGANDFDSLPSITLSHDGCEVTVSAIPVSLDRRDAPDHRPVGVIGALGASWVDHHTPIRDAVRKKARKYGRLRRPLLIAVNAVDMYPEKIDIMQALFGTEQYVIRGGPGWPKSEPEFSRKRDGAFIAPRGPINTRVSAVMIVSSLLPWTVAVHPPVVYHNPWARYPIGADLLPLTAHRPQANEMVETPGQPIEEILQIPARWPFMASA
jgi:hypothetical protein